MKLLILDDEKDYVEEFAEHAVQAGFKPPLYAYRVDDALGIVETERLAGEAIMAFVDLSLAGESGLDFIDGLNDRGILMPVCILSDTDDKESVFQAARMEAAVFIDKSRLQSGSDLLTYISLATTAYLEYLDGKAKASERAVSALADFYGEFIHDVRDIFIPIKSAAAAIREMAQDPPNPTSLQQITREADWILTKVEIGKVYVDALMEFNRTGQITCKREAVDLRSVIAEAWGAQSRSSDKIDLDLPEDAVFFLDPQGMERIFTALFQNIVAHVPEPARVRVIVRAQALPEASILRIGVGDDGPGIPRDDRDYIFLPGRRGVTAAPGGMGLGLAILSRWVTVHHLPPSVATVRCVEPPGGEAGAWFEIDLPLEMAR